MHRVINLQSNHGRSLSCRLLPNLRANLLQSLEEDPANNQHVNLQSSRVDCRACSHTLPQHPSLQCHRAILLDYPHRNHFVFPGLSLVSNLNDNHPANLSFIHPAVQHYNQHFTRGRDPHSNQSTPQLDSQIIFQVRSLPRIHNEYLQVNHRRLHPGNLTLNHHKSHYASLPISPRQFRLFNRNRFPVCNRPIVLSKLLPYSRRPNLHHNRSPNLLVVPPAIPRHNRVLCPVTSRSSSQLCSQRKNLARGHRANQALDLQHSLQVCLLRYQQKTHLHNLDNFQLVTLLSNQLHCLLFNQMENQQLCHRISRLILLLFGPNANPVDSQLWRPVDSLGVSHRRNPAPRPPNQVPSLQHVLHTTRVGSQRFNQPVSRVQ